MIVLIKEKIVLKKSSFSQNPTQVLSHVTNLWKLIQNHFFWGGGHKQPLNSFDKGSSLVQVIDQGFLRPIVSRTKQNQKDKCVTIQS